MSKVLFRLLVAGLTWWLFCEGACGQPGSEGAVLSGTVVDKVTGEPLLFASVVKSATEGTATDAAGRFRIRVGLRDTVTVTFVGYKSSRIVLPAGFAGPAYEARVEMVKDVILLRGVSIRPRSEAEFKGEFLDLKVDTEAEENARDNVAGIRQQGILGVIPRMDGFDNFRSFVNGPQGVTFFSTGPNKGFFRGLKKAVRKAPPPVGRSGTLPNRDLLNQWNAAKSAPRPALPDTTQPSRPIPADSLKPNKQ
ncbi:MAG: carboxypeptidase-like regulatory domain-containing protein [Ferruginibacter sp.]|nr:carboxypeptidase-like regulatory domain-containing protein [Cytophagales bacterium]